MPGCLLSDSIAYGYCLCPGIHEHGKCGKTMACAPGRRHVVFGEVVEGYEVVEAIESNPVGRGDAPVKPVTIKEAGEL